MNQAQSIPSSTYVRGTCLGLIYLRGSPQQRHAGLALLQGNRGVVTAQLSGGRLRAVMVRYRPTDTSASQLVHALRQAGHAAVWIGC